MLKTKIITINPDSIDSASISIAVEVLQAGGIVAFPTETVYGLGADATNESAISNVFKVKGRQPDNPLIVHIDSFDKLTLLSPNIPKKAKKLAEKFWPGPLTLVLEKSDRVSPLITANLSTVAVRMPKHPVALRLIHDFGEAIVGPSANLSGKPSPTRAEHVKVDLAGKIEMIIDGGETQIGIESTVVDFSVDPPSILRKGWYSQEIIAKVVGKVMLAESGELLRRSPGTRHRHYAPTAHVVLIGPNNSEQYQLELKNFRKQKKQVGSIIYSRELVEVKGANPVIVLPDDIEQIAKRIFHSIRELDALGVDVMLIESVAEEGLGIAVMDRLRRAAGVK